MTNEQDITRNIELQPQLRGEAKAKPPKVPSVPPFPKRGWTTLWVLPRTLVRWRERLAQSSWWMLAATALSLLAAYGLFLWGGAYILSSLDGLWGKGGSLVVQFIGTFLFIVVSYTIQGLHAEAILYHKRQLSERQSRSWISPHLLAQSSAGFAFVYLTSLTIFSVLVITLRVNNIFDASESSIFMLMLWAIIWFPGMGYPRLRDKVKTTASKRRVYCLRPCEDAFPHEKQYKPSILDRVL